MILCAYCAIAHIGIRTSENIFLPVIADNFYFIPCIFLYSGCMLARRDLLRDKIIPL